MKEKKLFITIFQLLLIYVLIINGSPSEKYLIKKEDIKKENIIIETNDYEYFYTIASWYGSAFHGKKMASGEIFDMNDASIAAHKNLKFGTKLEIINPENEKRIYVTIKDRGPYTKNREIDISYAAAKKLGIIESGVKKLKIRIID